MESGYLFTEGAGAVFDAYREFPADEHGHGIRYAARLDNGFGLAAFDGPAGRIIEFGTVYMMDPHPDYPDSWPDWSRPKAAPKRGVKQGDEWFSTIRLNISTPGEADVLFTLLELDEVSGLARIDDNGLWLVESHGPVMANPTGLNARATHAEQRWTEAPVSA